MGRSELTVDLGAIRRNVRALLRALEGAESDEARIELGSAMARLYEAQGDTEAAANLFAALRTLDAAGMPAGALTATGLGLGLGAAFAAGTAQWGLALALWPAGCAQYQVGPQSLYAPDVTTVYVPIFESHSYRRYLGNLSVNFTDEAYWQDVLDVRYAGVTDSFTLVNAAVGLFNLVPGFPLDGGRIFRAFWWWKTGSLQSATRTASNIGKGFAIVLMILGAFNIFSGNLIGGLWILFIGMFLRGAARMWRDAAALGEALRREEVHGVRRARDLDAEIAQTLLVLEVVDSGFASEQRRLAAEVLAAIDSGTPARARQLLTAKEYGHYVPLHDRLVRFMAETFGWVLEHFGADALLRFHRETAEAQRDGFERWERMTAEEFARATAFLVRQHMGRVDVQEDALPGLRPEGVVDDEPGDPVPVRLEITWCRHGGIPPASAERPTRFGPLADAFADPEEVRLVERHLGKRFSIADRPFAAWNTACFSDGAWISIPPNTRIDQPLGLVFLGQHVFENWESTTGGPGGTSTILTLAPWRAPIACNGPRSASAISCDWRSRSWRSSRLTCRSPWCGPRRR